MRNIFYVWVAILVGTVNLSAQLAHEVSAPIAVERFDVEARGVQKLISVELRNESGKTIVAYNLDIHFLDGEKVVESYGHARIDTLHVGMMPAGKEWTIETLSGGPVYSNIESLEREVIIDYVLFADDTSWGPDRNQQEMLIRATLGSTAAERRRLRTVLEEEGTEALLSDLAREVPRLRTRTRGPCRNCPRNPSEGH